MSTVVQYAIDIGIKMKRTKLNEQPKHAALHKRPTTVDDDLITRIAKALRMRLHEIAKEAGIERQAILELRGGSRGELIDVDIDPLWYALSDYVDMRIGLLLSIQEELRRKLESDRKKRAARRLRMERGY